MMLKPFLTSLLLCLGLCSGIAHAHKPSDSYLSLTIDNSGKNIVHGQWDIALRDLDFAIGLDSDGNGELSWDEVRARHADIAAYALSRLSLASSGRKCDIKPGKQLLDDHTDGAYTVLMFEADCPNVDMLTVQYSLLFDVDPQHKGLLKLVNRQGVVSTAIFSPDTGTQQFKLADADRLQQFLDYVKHGVWHIWIGFDHILFLLSLLLPAVLVSRNKKWEAGTSFKASALDVLKIVTAFTLAHSITLTLAALQYISLPSRWVESAIAGSVILAALNNLYPLFQGKRWVVAFAFGLIHGFGFASVLTDLGLPQSALMLALLGFNLGVEIGQLTIVAVFLPLSFLLRGTWAYRRLVFSAGSMLIVMIAAVWLVERAFNLRLISA
ncbi:HupE/UreJ family protein [Undibacterium sp. TJN25]|uniref:HupE/UreJ family protein n=1 Tax=Undibacterium sp. TJN25 TaxID=3413056 RepID=UPI003BF3FD4B